jgi:hypothetical protein
LPRSDVGGQGDPETRPSSDTDLHQRAVIVLGIDDRLLDSVTHRIWASGSPSSALDSFCVRGSQVFAIHVLAQGQLIPIGQTGSPAHLRRFCFRVCGNFGSQYGEYGHLNSKIICTQDGLQDSPPLQKRGCCLRSKQSTTWTQDLNGWPAFPVLPTPP